MQEQLFSKKERGKSLKKEEKVQIQICKYLRLQYPNVIFTCDLASGMRLPIHIATKNKSMRSSRGLPDLFIAHVRIKCKSLGDEKHEHISGLFIEIKSEDSGAILKDGSVSKGKHVQEQEAILKQLREQGYKAEFAEGFSSAKKIIDDYLR